MDSFSAARWIVPVCVIALVSCFPAFASCAYVYGGQFDLRIPAKPADPDEPDSRGWMDDAVLEIGDHLTIVDLDVGINVTHTQAFDLQIFLQSPAGTRICLNMYNPDEFFEGENYTDTIFDDEASLCIKEGQAPFTGRFRPMEPYQLSAFDGQDAFGPWRLQIYDAFYADIGALNGVELIVTAVEPPTLSVLTPNGGEVLLAGSTYTISWASTSSVDEVVIEYSSDGGSIWLPVGLANIGNSGSCDWQVPTVDSDLCLVRISDANDPGISDTSDGVFSIDPQMITVPDVVGMAQADAELAIISAGLVVGTVTNEQNDTVPAGRILSQSPTPGASIVAGAAVDLVVSCGLPAPVMPPIVMTLAASDVGRATAALRGLVIDDGGEACQYRFSYWTGGYYCCTEWSDPCDAKTAGELFGRQQTDLAPGIYCFAAQLRNSAGESDWGDLQVFSIRRFTGSGCGTESDPYIIRNVYELRQIDRDLTAWYELGSDIDASVTRTWHSGYGFAPIGRYREPFKGVLDGKGHVITGLCINRSSFLCIGLFACLEEGEIRDLGLADVTVSGYACVGGLVAANKGIIQACCVSGQVSGRAAVGGLAGLNNGLVRNCYSAANVVGVEQGTYIAGLVGRNSGGILEKCYSTGQVTGSECGGLVARSEWAPTPWVSGTNVPLCSHCFWDVETSGQTMSACGTGKTTAQMQTRLTFADAGWDFLNTWVICDRAGYPRLAWQIRPGDTLCPDGIDMVDFAFFAAHWRQSRPPGHNASTETADFNGSGQVDTTDLEVLTRNWLRPGR